MDWNKGFTGSFYAAFLDPASWHDIQRFEISGGSISRTYEGLRCSADIDCRNYEETKERWIRIWLDAKQERSSAHVPLFTGLACSPGQDINGRLIKNHIKCFSVLQPAQDILLPRGWYAPGGASGASVIKDLLSVTPAPVITDDDAPILSEPVIAEEGESRLTMTEKILTAIGWRMKIEGDGTIYAGRPAEDVSAYFDPVSNDIIEPHITTEYDWYLAPNVLRAVTDTGSITVKDESDGPLSVQTRGREIWIEETDCQLSDTESLESYARRRLKEEQAVCLKASYDRRFHPEVLPGDIVRLRYPEQKLDGEFIVRSQVVMVGSGARTSEEVVRYESNG